MDQWVPTALWEDPTDLQWVVPTDPWVPWDQCTCQVPPLSLAVFLWDPRHIPVLADLLWVLVGQWAAPWVPTGLLVAPVHCLCPTKKRTLLANT